MSKKSEIKALEKKLKKMKANKPPKKARKASQRRQESETALSVVNTPQAAETRSVTISQPTNIARLMPNTPEALKDMAQLMAKGGPMVGSAFREKPGACAAIIMQATRLNMDPFALSLEAYTVKDSVGYSGKMIAGIVQSHPQLKGRLRYEYKGEITLRTRYVVVSGVFKGDDHIHSLETPPLSKIHPQNSPLWKSDPDQQLAYYGARAWGRRYASDIMAGLISDEEASVAHELDDTRSNSQKRLDDIKAKKAAANKPDPEEDIVDVEYEDIDQEPEPEEAEVVHDEAEQVEEPEEAAPASSGNQTLNLPDEAHDWFEVLETQYSSEEVSKMWEVVIMPAPWFKALSKEQSAEIFRVTQDKLNELNGE